jgi:DNA-binding LytR/AlgR family response regulator
VIFTTAHKDFALAGFDLDAVDYLLKPFSFERFVKAVNRITSGKSAPTAEADKTADTFLYFRVDRKMVRVGLEEIVYIESLKDYSRIIRTGQNPPLVTKKTISSIEEMLPEDRFLRIHRSFIIAIHKVTAFTNNDVEIGDREIPIGKLYRHQLARLTHCIPPP